MIEGVVYHFLSTRSLVNDLAVTTRALQQSGEAQRVAILDADVHQGDGTAAILSQDPDVLTVSVHAANNYPARKVRQVAGGAW